MGRPPSSTRLKVEDCGAISVSMLTGLDRMYGDHEQEISGTVAGISVCFTVKLVRGSRGWVFVCPQCRGTTRVLHFPPGSDQPGCRVCLGLLYESQSWTRDMRVARRTRLMQAFYDLQPSWRAFIGYVEIAANEGDAEMKKLLSAHKGLTVRERRKLSPEALCDKAGVSITALIRAVVPLLWQDSKFTSAFVEAIYSPGAIHRLAQAGLGNTPTAARSREMFLKISGARPVCARTKYQIQSNPSGRG